MSVMGLRLSSEAESRALCIVGIDSSGCMGNLKAESVLQATRLEVVRADSRIAAGTVEAVGSIEVLGLLETTLGISDGLEPNIPSTRSQKKKLSIVSNLLRTMTIAKAAAASFFILPGCTILSREGVIIAIQLNLP